MPVPLYHKAEPLQSPGQTLLWQAGVKEELGMSEPIGTGEEEEPQSV